MQCLTFQPEGLSQKDIGVYIERLVENFVVNGTASLELPLKNIKVTKSSLILLFDKEMKNERFFSMIEKIKLKIRSTGVYLVNLSMMGIEMIKNQRK